MKKIFLPLILLCFFGFEGIGQNAIVGSGFTNGWNAGCGSGTTDFEYFSASAGGSYISTQNAIGTGNQYWRFGIDWGGTIAQRTITVGVDTEVNPNTEYTLNGTCATSGALYTNVSSTSDNYIFKTSEAGSNPAGLFIFFRIQGTVRSVSSVSTPSVVLPNKNITIEATLDGALSTGQGVYLRYTNDGYSTSTVVEMTGIGTSYSAVIPSSINTASASISYYVFTSGNGLTISSANADFYTINLNNNSGSNYSYTVASSTLPGSGNMLTFDGTDDNVSISSLADQNFSNSITAEAWVYPTASTNFSAIIAQAVGVSSPNEFSFVVDITSSNYFSFLVSDGSTFTRATSSETINLNQWYHVAGIYDGANAKLYVNGVEKASVSFTGSIGSIDSPVLVGQWSTPTTNNLFQGSIDEVRVWNTALSESQIRSGMCSKITSSHTNFGDLLAYFDFDESSGSYVGNIGSAGGGILNSSPTSSLSKAAIGDESTYSYGSGNATTVTETHSDGSTFKIDGFTGIPDGAHVYLVNEAPNSATRPEFSGNLDETRYYGTFVVGGTSPTYNITYDYTNNTNITSGTEAEARLGARNDNSVSTWSILTSNADLDQETNTITKGCYSATQKEFIAGFDNTEDYAVEPGSGYALSFDGSNDYVACSSSLTSTLDDFTLEGWINYDGSGNQWFFSFDQGGNYDERIQVEVHAGTITFGWQSGSNGQGWTSFSGGTIANNTWYHVAITNSSSSGKQIFVNGILVNSNANTLSPSELSGTVNFDIGRLFHTSSNHYFGGKMDEVRLWDKVLSASEIQEWMTQKITPDHPDYCNLKAYYRFDENTGTTVKDYAGNNDGNINGATYQTSSAPTGGDAAVNATSVTTATSLNLASGAGDDITVNVTSGTADLLQVVRVDGSPNNKTNPGGIDNMSAYNYFVVKGFGASSFVYEIVYNWDGHAGITDESELYICSRPNNSSSWTVTSATRDVGANTLTLTGQTGTEFILGSGIPGNVLPVDLISFSVTELDEKPLLTWSTSSEINSAYFEVQTSIDAKEWKAIHKESAAGNSNQERICRFVDEYSAINDFIYYRLKQVDLDGSFTYTNVVKYEQEKEYNQVKVFPNPTTGVFNLQFTEIASKTIRVRNSMGVIVEQIQIGGQLQTQIDLTSQPKGIYFIEVMDNYNSKFIPLMISR